MAGWYVRRGEKIIGPVELPKLQELASAGRVVPTDLLSKDVAGPWKEAVKTSLFAKPSELTSLVAPMEQSPPAVTIEPPADAPLTTTLPQKGLAAFAFIGRGMLATGSAASRAMATRSQRKHELKVATIQAQALADSRRPLQQRQQPMAAPPPQVTQATIIKITNKNTAYGCSGCGTLLLLILIGIFVAIVMSQQNYK